MRSEALAARNALSLAQARAAADGAVERAAFELSRPRNAPEAWEANGETHAWQDGTVAVAAAATDESAKIDLNAAPEPLLKGLFQNVGGLDADAAQALVEAILDWRDPDDLRRPNGAEEPDYRAAGRKYRPSNAPFETVGEVQRVLGMTPELYARVADSLTVYSRQAGVNPATASRDVLLALPGAAADAVDAYLAQRRDARASKLPVPPFPGAQGFAAGAVPVWRIRAGATLPDGVTFVRDAVLRPSGDPKRPLITLLWQEGPRAPLTEPNAAAPGAATSANGSGKP
jgi:general secretion pathway protein K